MLRKIDCLKEEQGITEWIQQIFNKSHLDYIIIGLSGGIDSATAATLSTKAVGRDHLIVVMLPYGTLNPEGLADAKQVIASLKIPEKQIHIINIEKAVNACTANMKMPDEVRKGNTMARIRMTYLFDLAKQYNGLVCGTENKSEYYLGYFTRFGDEASDFEPIRHLYKTHIWELARHLNIPEKIITKAPTAGLWENQTDEKEFGFSYQVADMILYLYFEQRLSENDILKKGIPGELLRKVIQRVKTNEFKHHLPVVYQ